MKTKAVEYNTLDYLKDDIELQKEYISNLLTEYIKDNNIEAFLLSLEPLIKIQGSVAEFAKKSGINRTYFYKLFKHEVTPEFPTIARIIKSLGFDIDFKLNHCA